MIRAILCTALAAALAGSSVAAAPDPGVDALKQRIWAAFSDVDAAQGKLPPALRATGPALQQLYRSKRDPVVAELWAIGAADPRSPRVGPSGRILAKGRISPA